MIDISFKLISAAHPYEQYNIVVRRNVAQVSVPESPCMVHETYYTQHKPTTLSQPNVFLVKLYLYPISISFQRTC